MKKSLSVLILCPFFVLYINAQEPDSISKIAVDKILALGLFEERIYGFKNTGLPEFRLHDLDGQLISSKDFLGKPLVINIWFSTCEPCLEEMPILNELAEKYKGQISFLAITFESRSDVESFLEKRKFQFQHLVGAKEYIRKFGMFGYPKTLIIDSDQKIVEILKLLPKQEDIPDSLKREDYFKGRFETFFESLLEKE